MGAEEHPVAQAVCAGNRRQLTSSEQADLRLPILMSSHKTM